MKLQPFQKRVPASKSGRLLVYVRYRLCDSIRTGAINEAEFVQKCNALTKRIQKRLDKETQKKYPQGIFFLSFKITFIKPRRKRISTEVVHASTRRRANAMIRERYGKQTKILPSK